MLKQVYEIFTLLFTVTQRLNRHDDAIEKIQQESKANSELINRLILEQARANDEIKRHAEREAEARKLFQLQVENHLLRAAHSLPPAAETGSLALLKQEEPRHLQARVESLSAALQRASEQQMRDQAEIERLKAQMATLLAERQKQES
ncbi:MAG: hypothetical protein ACREEM_31245 [Blastocatellia bacterium]